MNAVELVRELEGLGVKLWEDRGELRFRAPSGLMTQDRLAVLRKNKQAVLAYVCDNDDATQLKPDPASRFEPFPLTDVQSAYLLGRRDVFDYGGVACHGYGELEFVELSTARLERAWRALVERHDMLRAVVDVDGSQHVLAEVPAYEVAVDDLRGAGESAAAEALSATRAAMDHRVYTAGEWPLFELRVTLTDVRAYLHFSIDFLIADFVSIQLILDELHLRYADPDVELPVLELSFRDYLLAERGLRSGARYERDRAYWLDRIELLPPAPELPMLERAVEAPPRFTRRQMWLDEDEWAALRTAAGARGVTVSGGVLAAYAETIGRWARRREFTLDLTLLNRSPLHPQVEKLVGDFTSVELLAVRDEPGSRFCGRAQALQARLWEDLDHGRYSGVELVREIARKKGAGNALFPIVFTSAIGLDPAAGDGQRAPFGELGYGISQTPQVWIDCQVMERHGQLSLNWDVRQGIFPEGVVEDMFSSFELLLRLLASEPEVWDRVEAIPLPTSQQKRRRQVNDTATPVPEALLHEGAVGWALSAPDRVAVVDRFGSLTYGELLARAAAVAERLRSADCARGELVGVVMDKGNEQIVGVIGTLLAGAAYLPIDVAQPPARRDEMLTAAGVRSVLTQSWLTDAPWLDDVSLLAVDTLAPAALPMTLPERIVGPEEIAYVIFTSGSTGTPNGVMISHRAAQNTVADVSSRYELTADTRMLGLASLGFDLSVYDIFGTLALGGCLILPDPMRRGDPSHWAELVERHGVTVWNSVPAQLQMLSDFLRGEPGVELSTLRLAMLSGDWIPVSLPDQIRSRLPGLRLISMGGATEAAIWSIYHPIAVVPEGSYSIPYGRPLANQSFDVLDERLRSCPDWTPGELYIGGVGLALGYLGDEAKTAEKFICHPDTGERLYRTGDIGRYLPSGEIEFLGREDSQVKIRGHRIELAEIEAVLGGLPGVAAVAVIAHGETPLERRLAAFVEQARQPLVDALAPAVAESAQVAGAGVMAEVDLDRYFAYAEALNDLALDSMADALRRNGLFATRDDFHSVEQIVERTGAVPRHHRLVRRWLTALTEQGVLRRSEDGRLGGLSPADRLQSDAAWAGLDGLRRRVDEGATELLSYFRVNAERLPALLRDEEDPLALLFPDGRLDVVESLYEKTLLNRFSTAIMAAAVKEIAASRSNDGPLRVLEVGAGVGGSTAAALSALSGCEVDYLFTDISHFFLNTARRRFTGDARVRFGIFDLERDARSQGFEPNSFDIVLAADVLHSTRNVEETLDGLRQISSAGGWLVFAEMTRDQYQIMASLELLTRVDETAHDFVDLRRGNDQTFLSRDQWLDALKAAGAELVFALPGSGDPLIELGMQVFAARFKCDRVPLRPDDLLRRLGDRLPPQMLPVQLQVIDAMPLTGNGKVDQRTLSSWIAASAPARGAGAEAAPQSELESRIAEVWAEMLAVEHVEHHRDFFELGGDSLLAAQITGRLREVVPEAADVFFDELLRELLEGPTVAGMAASLAAHVPNATHETSLDACSPLVQLASAEGGLPSVLVHGSDGTLDGLDTVTTALAGGGPVLGLRAVDPDDRPIEDELMLQRLASTYARVLLSEGHLSLRLVGFGLGGVLALETARSLMESGAEVLGLTVMGTAAGELDGYRPAPYLGDVTLLQPEDDHAREHNLAWWRDYCLGDLRVVPLPGTAGAALRSPSVSTIAAAVRSSDLSR
ncbi:MAG TPA: amino acid adenylation domain-containing protein [Solirubrobacteraceae bacterium]|jgi:pyochelin synthetase|nr:amino acid adenylation domain-containing protein [Solirubrobacteraceae bacterium]